MSLSWKTLTQASCCLLILHTAGRMFARRCHHNCTANTWNSIIVLATVKWCWQLPWATENDETLVAALHATVGNYSLQLWKLLLTFLPRLNSSSLRIFGYWFLHNHSCWLLSLPVSVFVVFVVISCNLWWISYARSVFCLLLYSDIQCTFSHLPQFRPSPQKLCLGNI